MSLIVGQGVGKAYDAGFVLRNVSFRLAPGESVALVGANGEGKTTLLRMLAGLTEPTAGRIERPDGVRVGYLPQHPPVLDGGTLWDHMLETFADVRDLETELHEASARLAENPSVEHHVRRYGQLQARFEAAGGYDYETRIRIVLTGLGFPADRFGEPLERFSGGQQSRAMLARLLLTGPDVLLLDEPTNHLDLDAVEWLERYLGSLRSAMVIVAHDRYFLDRLAERTWEVAFGALETYKGNYTAYLKQRDHRLAERRRLWESQQAYIRRTEEFIRRNMAGQRGKEARGRQTRLERFRRDEAIAEPREHVRASLRLPEARRSGDPVFRAEDLLLGYAADTPIVQAERLDVRAGDRVAIIGPNGSGKTTLLRALRGELEPLSGSLRRGANLEIGYLTQTQAELDPNRSAVDEVLAAAGGGMIPEQARTLLGGLGLRGDEAFQPTGTLSGGQRSRVALARLCAAEANVLLLDEPTNHLDLATREVLQEALDAFGGTIVFVSHDRYLIDELARRIWAVDGGRVHRINGGWQDCLHWRAGREGADQAGESAGAAKAGRKASYEQARRRKRRIDRLQRRQGEIEEEIHRLEAELEDLNRRTGEAGEQGDMQRVERLGEEYSRKDERLRTCWREWEDLTHRLDAAGETASERGASK